MPRELSPEPSPPAPPVVETPIAAPLEEIIARVAAAANRALSLASALLQPAPEDRVAVE